MLLAIDMGNTHIVTGCIDGDRTLFAERLSTEHTRTELEYAMNFEAVLKLHGILPSDIDGAIISSVVPPLTNTIAFAVEKIIGQRPMVVGPGVKTGLNILMDNPRTVGADLVVASVAGISEYGAPLIMIDMGTATTFAVIDKDGNYTGGIIAPGMEASLSSLVARTAQLPNISLEAPACVIGKNTVDSMRSGLVLGCAAMLDGLIDRIEEELGYKAAVVATGGMAGTVIPVCSHSITVDNELLLKGLNLIYHKNRGKSHKNA
ncbi:MAG: type III pantothenate kinase [Butyrivibrio sp.]|nr:type III pantothenate kinase [Butyrivibrio sp.]